MLALHTCTERCAERNLFVLRFSDLSHDCGERRMRAYANLRLIVFQDKCGLYEIDGVFVDEM